MVSLYQIGKQFAGRTVRTHNPHEMPATGNDFVLSSFVSAAAVDREATSRNLSFPLSIYSKKKKLQSKVEEQHKTLPFSTTSFILLLFFSSTARVSVLCVLASGIRRSTEREEGGHGTPTTHRREHVGVTRCRGAAVPQIQPPLHSTCAFNRRHHNILAQNKHTQTHTSCQKKKKKLTSG